MCHERGGCGPGVGCCAHYGGDFTFTVVMLIQYVDDSPTTNIFAILFMGRHLLHYKIFTSLVMTDISKGIKSIMMIEKFKF